MNFDRTSLKDSKAPSLQTDPISSKSLQISPKKEPNLNSPHARLSVGTIDNRSSEELLFGKDEESALSCLCALVKSSKYHCDNKAISHLWEIIQEDKHSSSIRHNAFKAIVNSLCYAQLKFSEKIEKVFIWAIEENSEKITKLLIKGITSIKVKYINYRIVQKLWDLRTYSDEQLLSLLKVIADFTKTNSHNYPEEVLKMLLSESSNNANQDVRLLALSILKELKKEGDIPSDISDRIDYETNLLKLKETSDSKEITKILKGLNKIDFSSTPISTSTLDAVAYLFSNEDSNVYVKYILRFISRVVSENIPVTHQFIDAVVMYCSQYQDNEVYINIIKDLIHKYDQYCNSDILKYALKGIRKSSEDKKQLWLEILVGLSKRNVKFTSEYLIKLLAWISNADDVLFEVIKNAVSNLEQVSIDFVGRLEDMLTSGTHQSKVLEVLVEVTKNGTSLSKETILLLLKLSQSNKKDCKSIFEILMNLRNNNCELPEAAVQLGEFISQLNIIKSKDQSLSSITDAVLEIANINSNSDISQFITYESLIKDLEELIKQHADSQLSL